MLKRRGRPPKHGLCSREVLLAHEDPREFKAFSDQLTETLNPEGAGEVLFAGRMISALWRMRRGDAVEASVMDRGYQDALPRDADLPLNVRRQRAESSSVNNDRLPDVQRYRAAIEREFYRAYQGFQAARASRVLGLPLGLNTLKVSLVVPYQPVQDGDMPSLDALKAQLDE